MLTKFNKYIEPLRILCLIAIIAMIIISCLIYGANLGKLIGFLILFAVIVEVPGLGILSYSKIKFNFLATKIAAGFFLGWSFQILIFFIGNLFHIQYTFILSIISTIFFLPFLYRTYFKQLDLRAELNENPKKRLEYSKSRNNISTIFLFFIVLVLLYALLRTQYQYLSPTMSHFTYVNPDKAYHMGLINSLSHGYPLKSIWVDGIQINYHIFTEILYSIFIVFFDADFILMSCSPYLTTFAISISFYAFFKEFSKHPERAGLYSLLIILSNLYITRNINSSLGLKFAIENDNAAGFGISAMFVVFIIMKYWYKSHQENNADKWKLLIILSALIMLLTGIKGPMGAVVIGGIWGAYLFGLCLREIKFKSIVPILILSACFLLVYMTVLGSKGQTGANGQTIFSFATITNIAFWKKGLIAFMKSIGLPKIIRLGFILLVFMIFFLTAYFLPFCVGYIRELILIIGKKKDFDFTKVCIYAACTVGLILMFVLNYSGHSQVYFGLVSLFLAPIISYWLFEDFDKNNFKTKFQKNAIYTIKIIFTICIVLTSITLISNYAKNIENAKWYTNPNNKYDKYLSISKDEYKAMEWIEDNTEEDAMLATDRFYSVSPKVYTYKNRWMNRFFMYGAYGNRFIYFSGSGYNIPPNEWKIRKIMNTKNQKLYNINNEKRGADARSLDVDYVVVSKRFTKVPNLENKDYKKCYSNKDVIIYKVKASK